MFHIARLSYSWVRLEPARTALRRRCARDAGCTRRRRDRRQRHNRLSAGSSRQSETARQGRRSIQLRDGRRDRRRAPEVATDSGGRTSVIPVNGGSHAIRRHRAQDHALLAHLRGSGSQQAPGRLLLRESERQSPRRRHQDRWSSSALIVGFPRSPVGVSNTSRRRNGSG